MDPRPPKVVMSLYNGGLVCRTETAVTEFIATPPTQYDVLDDVMPGHILWSAGLFVLFGQ